MSHITKIKVEVKDLTALEHACEELGCIFHSGVKKYTWFGTFVGDTKIPDGVKIEDLGKCDHMIEVPGVEYQIGVVKQPDGIYQLIYDYYASGRKIEQQFGRNLERFAQMYSVEKVRIEAEDRGLVLDKTILEDGTMQLVIGGAL